jgi:hypothetical protein
MTKISQGFDCEVDDENWLSITVSGLDLVIRMYSGEESADCTLSSGQVQNLIEFLTERALPALLSAEN